MHEGIGKAQCIVGCWDQPQAQGMMAYSRGGGCGPQGTLPLALHNPDPPSTPSPVQQAQRRLRSSPQELERQALAKHVRAEALSSTLRLAQDEALRAKNLLLTDKMKPE